MCVHEYVSGLQVVSSACPGHDIFQLTNTGSGAAAAPDALVTKADILPERHTTVEETDQDAGGVGGTTGGGGGAFGDLVSGGRGGGGRDGAKKTKASSMHFGAVIKMVTLASVLDFGAITNQVIATVDSEVYQNSENHDPNQAMELVDDLASLPTRRTNLTEKKKTPRSDDSFAFSTIAPPSKTNVKGKKTTPTSDDASTPPPLPPTLHAISMCYCEQLAGDTLKTEEAMELVDDRASLPTRRKKKKTPRSDDLYSL